MIVKGRAGTAKTFFALAVGLHKIMNQKEKQYRKIFVCRPNVKFDEDIGYLPAARSRSWRPSCASVSTISRYSWTATNTSVIKYESELRDKVD